MDIGKCMHGNGPECERCKAMDIPEVEEMEVTITELRAEVEAAKEQLEFDRTTCAGFVTALDKALDSRFWLTEGRGSYQWDDDRYREEFRDAAVALKAVIEPMRKMACNLSSGLQTTEQVVKARVDLRAEVERLRGELDAHVGKQALKEMLRQMLATADERDQLRNTVAGLRRALEEIGRDCDNPSEAKIFDQEIGKWVMVWVIEADALRAKLLSALAASPDEHARRIKAEIIQEAADSVPADADAHDWFYMLVSKYKAESDRLEKEATNGR